MLPLLTNKTVAILATDGFENSELLKPRAALDAAGATTKVVSLKPGSITGEDSDGNHETVAVDLTVESADPSDFHALLLPGGVKNPDTLRMDPGAVAFVRTFLESGKPVAAICHAPWILINAGAAQGRKMTSWPSLETDLTNAGAEWVDQEVVCDQGIVTSRNPNDIPAFCDKMIEEIAEGRHERAFT